MPQPGDAEALVRSELGREGREQRWRGQRGKVSQSVAASPPGFRRLKSGRKLLEDFLGLSDARTTHAMRASRGNAGGEFAGEHSLRFAEPCKLAGIEQENFSIRLKITAIRRDRGANAGVIR